MKISFILISVIFLLAAGCIEKEDNMDKISILAEGFKDGELIPDEYTCKGKDVSPSLSWTGIPAGTKSITLIMDDPDAPGGTFVHWVLYNVPSETRKLAPGMPLYRTFSDGTIQGMTDFGQPGYGGPCPPPGKPHRYYFKIYALDTDLNLQPGATKSQVESAMKGHVLAKGELMGKYWR